MPLLWPYNRANLMLASFASQPELQKNTLSIPDTSHNLSAKASCSAI